MCLVFLIIWFLLVWRFDYLVSTCFGVFGYLVSTCLVFLTVGFYLFGVFDYLVVSSLVFVLCILCVFLKENRIRQKRKH